MGLQLPSCSDCGFSNALHRTVCRSCGASLPVSSEQPGYETLDDIVDEATVWYGKPFVTTNFGFRGIIFWGLILSLVFYFTGLLAAVFVLGLVSVLYLVFLLFAIVLIILKVTAGTIKEVRYDLLKIRGEIDYLRRKEKEE